MTRILLALTLGLATLLMAAPARVQEVAAGPAVGRLNIAGFKHLEMCSGTLVTPDTVLTAAHCVMAPDGGAKRLSDMVFVAGWDGAGHTGAANIASVRVHPRAFRNGRLDIAHDVALVRLARPIAVTPLPVVRSGPKQDFTLMGYPRTSPHRVRTSFICPAQDFRRLWRIGCAVEQGQSGGPVLLGEGADLRIVGVISAITEGDTLAVPVDPWLLETLAQGG